MTDPTKLTARFFLFPTRTRRRAKADEQVERIESSAPCGLFRLRHGPAVPARAMPPEDKPAEGSDCVRVARITLRV